MGAGCCPPAGYGPNGKKLSKEDQKKQTNFLKKASYVRNNTATKSIKQPKEKDEIIYCTGKDAVDCLMKSKYFEKDPKKQELPRTERDENKFYSRQECIQFCHLLLMNKMFFRGVKIFKEDSQKQIDVVKDEENATDSNSENKEAKQTKKTKKKKYRIDINKNQGFYDDSEEIFIWMYHPTPFMHWVYGGLVLLVVIGGTLFPLWPPTLRTGVYYCSVSLASFIGGLLVVAFLRTILFGIIWACTMGTHHLWILPNLVEDVGFFESFVPLYTYKIKDSDGKLRKAKKD